MHGASRKAGRAPVTPAGLRSAEAGTPEPCGAAQIPPRCAIICSANGLFNGALSTHPRCDGGIGKLGGSARRIGVRDANGHIVNVLLAQLFRDGGKRESCGRTPKPRDVYTHLCAARGFDMQTAISTKYCLLILAATAGIGKPGRSTRAPRCAHTRPRSPMPANSLFDETRR